MYTVEYEKIVEHINNNNAKRVLVQLPDGLKNKSLEILQHIEKGCENTQVLFWSGTNFGACDLPTGLDKLGVDLLIHLGHTEWVY